MSKNIIKIAIVIQLVIIGITIYKLVDAEAFVTYSNSGSPLYNHRTEGRKAEIKSITTTLLIETCILGLVVFLIKKTKK